MLVAADPAVLKPWLIRALEPISDAEPTVLADYVLALLKRDVGDLDELRQFCVQQLDDFLEQHSASFIDSLLRFLDSPGNASPLRAVQPAAGSALAPSLKRARSPQPALSPAKLPRFHPGAERQPSREAGPPAPAQPFGLPIDARSYRPAAAGQRPPCRDYHFRGFCARGGNCPFQHDAMPPAAPSPAAFPPYQQPLPFPPPGSLPPGLFPTSHVSRPSPSSYTRPTPSSARPAQRPARGTSRVISIDNIPQASLTDAAVRHFFQPFGTILDLSIDVEGRTAAITFAAPDQADRAVASPQAVFGNRFVRVYRSHDTGTIPHRSSPAPAIPPPPPPALAVAAIVSPAPRASPTPSRAELLLRNAEEQRALLAEVEHADKVRKSAIMASLRQLAQDAEALRGARDAVLVTMAKPETPTGSADAMARLHALQREAASLGIDTQAGGSTPSKNRYGSGPPVQHRPPPRRAPQHFRLDNRSRRVRIGLLDGAKMNPERIRAYFETFGPVTTLDHVVEDNSCTIEFDSRKSAEQAMAAGALPQELGVSHLSWADSKVVGGARPSPSPSSVDPSQLDVAHGQTPNELEARVKQEDDRMVDDGEERSWNR